MRPSSFILALVCTSILAATAVYATQCGYGGYDFSSLANSDLNFTDGTYNYYLRPCGVVSESPCLAMDSSASACQEYIPQNLTFVTGINKVLTWGVLPNDQGAYYNLTGEGNCWASGQPTFYYTNVEFICGNEYSLSVSVFQCTQTYSISTPLACGVPPPKSSCGYENLDFSSLMNRDIVGSDGGSEYSYHLSVCGQLNDQPQCTGISPTSSTCQVQVQPQGAAYDTGDWYSPEWFYIDDSNPKLGAGYHIMGAKECWSTGEATFYVSNVLFTCAESEGPLTVVAVGPLGCLFNYTLPTPLACGGGFGKDLPAIATE